jgi:uncharacterized protein (TIGR04255 family)
MNPTDESRVETRWRRYDRAPLREAVLDIRIKPIQSVNVLESLHLSEYGYTEKKKILHGHLTLKTLEAGDLATSTEQEHAGFQFVGAERKYLAQFRVDGFTLTRLAPYEAWGTFRDEAQRLWPIYCQAMGGPIEVNRASLRYVNQLDIPMPIRDLRDYIRTYPEISSDLSQLLSSYFMQIHIPQVDGCVLILSEALVPPPEPSKVSVVLDLDMIKEGLRLVTDDELWSTLELLRVRKNLAFEGCITNATRELIR